MKKSTLIISTVLTTFSLTALALNNLSTNAPNEEHQSTCQAASEKIEPPTFFFSLESRFMTTVSKSELNKAKTIIDIVPKDERWAAIDFDEVTIRVLPNKNTDFAEGTGKSLNPKQIELLKSINYSANFVIDAYRKSKNPSPQDYFPYYLTVVPENQVNYDGGLDLAVNFLKEKSEATIAKTQRGNLKSGKISFVITKAGSIEKIDLNSTCGYKKVDLKMIELIQSLPKKWAAATNENGDKIDQTLVFSFGTTGC